MKRSTQKRVFVGLSGGVDSSVAALRLLQAGYEVVGVFIKVWQPDFVQCNWEQERLDAMRVAAHLQIPFLTCDAETAYKQDVADHFIAEYLAGRTPNPDVMCNQYVKFGRFLEFATQHGADYIATGHYAQKRTTNAGYQLWRGNDTEKDQSYFLWTLTQTQLSKTLLPVGESNKATIRKEAERAKLPVAQKKDSQGVCFLGHIDIPEFLSHFTELKEGLVYDTSGKHIGVHKGALVYTIGQRHGFTISSTDNARTPYFVVKKDVQKNTLIVSKTAPTAAVVDKDIHLTDCNWIPNMPTANTLEVQTRYRQKPHRAQVTIGTPESTVSLPNTAEQPVSGQSAVFYQGDQCLGGGIIA
ncbi:tRNA 2-thiouridine(34) synthase MnmA [Candidatus Nomurabacteria bacterium]|nr:tRNA 2-thiouridine(34) synthase MnmA [Candidatus Nomurabacteria bacterium]